jgi:hypothetical protein
MIFCNSYEFNECFIFLKCPFMKFYWGFLWRSQFNLCDRKLQNKQQKVRGAMSVPAPLDNNKETHGFLPGLWACFSRKFVHYRFSEMPLPALKNIIGVRVDRNCPTLS